MQTTWRDTLSGGQPLPQLPVFLVLLIGFFFCCNGSILKLLFEDELEQFTDLQKNMVNGALTGALFSSTRGLIPMGVGSVTGLGIVLGLHYGIEWLRERDYIDFQMKY